MYEFDANYQHVYVMLCVTCVSRECQVCVMCMACVVNVCINMMYNHANVDNNCMHTDTFLHVAHLHVHTLGTLCTLAWLLTTYFLFPNRLHASSAIWCQL